MRVPLTEKSATTLFLAIDKGIPKEVSDSVFSIIILNKHFFLMQLPLDKRNPQETEENSST